MGRKKLDIEPEVIIGIIMFSVIIVSVILMIVSLCVDQVCITNINENGEKTKEFYNLAEMIARNKTADKKIFLYADVIQALLIATIVSSGFSLIAFFLNYIKESEIVTVLVGVILILSAICWIVAIVFDVCCIWEARAYINELGGELTTMAGGWLIGAGGLGMIVNVILGGMLIDI